MALQLTTSYVEDSLTLFAYYKKLGEGAIAQVPDARLFEVMDEESNSIGIIVKHMAGNMRSRWTDFLTSDGEKPWRDRDAEFEGSPLTREALMQMWGGGWACVFGALEPLTDADLSRTITIRGEAHSVLQAIGRQLTHYAYHVGQIVMLAKHFQGPAWKKLSIPRGQSAEFNRRVQAGDASQR
ncbi:MAG TPA: DUF1572 domain-containing protein [Bryobacteraceae bacterium]|nr:DUF1572 domain-containing protein [Bryobacteraceae bacterium]